MFRLFVRALSWKSKTTRVASKEAELKAKVFEERLGMRRFVCETDKSESESSSSTHVDIATRYFERIAGDTYDRLSRIFETLPSIELLENMRVNNILLKDIASITFTSSTEVSIGVKSRSLVKPVIDALIKFDKQWKVSMHTADHIRITAAPATPTHVENRVSQVRQVGQWARNSITERRTNLIKKAKLEIRDIGQERDVIAKISSLAEKFKQAVEKIESEKVSEMRK